MIRNFLAIIFLAVASLTFGQVKVNLNESPPDSSIVATYNFVMMLPEITDSLVIFQSRDKDGTTIYMEMRKDMFHGKINIIIHPNQELGPVTEENTINWHVLPPKK
jgi:hypothetical protein